ncbi:Protein mesA [Leucoagaricus sp. SymC.cos]|nr:Protein mesA [Leucoagaricus sp. SymC.cos]
MTGSGNHCSFVLLAEFHIYEGPQLKYQFPQPLGVDESLLATSMLPDGAEAQLDDWTVFFLNQTPFNTISPVLALDTPEVKSTSLPGDGPANGKADKQELLCVLNLVRTKHDKTLDRGAKVLALAICTRHSYIQIFKASSLLRPFLLLAIEDYFTDPSQDCLARLFDAVNSMDLSAVPVLTRQEKLVMRSSERKDIFAEKFSQRVNSQSTTVSRGNLHKPSNSGGSYSSFEEGLLMRGKDKDKTQFGENSRGKRENGVRPRTDTGSSSTTPSVHASGQSQDSPPSDTSFSLGGSAVWVGDESGLDLTKDSAGDSNSVASLTGSSTAAFQRKRRSTGTSSSSSQAHSREHHARQINASHSYYDTHLRHAMVKDTHFYHTTVTYRDHPLPIKLPLTSFPEEVGDYSLISLIKVFNSPQLVSGPTHPHLHTSGPLTHPIIILFNGLITGKRIIFLGHRRPAGDVSNFVLSACALASGCGVVLQGFIERAFPYANLENREEWESVPAYIAGVTNPIFEASRAWDLLFDISSGNVTIAKDIHTKYPVVPPAFGAPPITRSGTLKVETSAGSDVDFERKDGAKNEGITTNSDRVFIEDIRAAIEDHFGEGLVRMRFTEYVARFVRLASRYEEELTGATKFGHRSGSFTEMAGQAPKLGSGIAFADEAAGLRELAANAHRIEAWRRTSSYHYCIADYETLSASSAIRGFDVLHQLFRVRHGKNMADSEILAIMRALADNVKTYEQVVELLSFVMAQGQGLLHLGFGLFHQKEAVRDATVDLFNNLRAFPVGVSLLQSLNHFQRYAYVRQAHAKEKKQQQQEDSRPEPKFSLPGTYIPRLHSNSVVNGNF